MKPETELMLWPLEISHAIGKRLVDDDFKDFPWHPFLNGDPWDPVKKTGHMPGMPHHGMIGFLMQFGTEMAAMALVGMDLAEEAGESKSVFVQEMERWESVAHPAGGALE